MITVPTTFVIGAGCSKPYGLPLGEDLFRRMKDISPRHPLFQALIVDASHNRVDETRIQAFNRLQEAARHHRGQSIDALLEDQAEHRAAGREVIAALMGAAIQARKKVGITPALEADWLRYLSGEMRGGGARTIDDFATGNKVTFVTFNFDTIIEEQLQGAAWRFYGGAAAVDPLEHIKVIHVHGRLPDVGDGEISREWVLAAAPFVKVIHDDLDPDTVAAARNAIETSEVICFLGFRYEKQNLLTLGIPQVLGVSGHKHVYGSAMGLERGERQRVERRFDNRIELGEMETDARLFLRKFDVIRS